MGRADAANSGAISPPATERGRRTRQKLLEAATSEFGERGFHETSISEITRRAGVALGSFYTYFESKEAIFKALVREFSDGVRQAAATGIEDSRDSFEKERDALSAFLDFAREHKEIYRIIDEAEFVDPASYRAHYENTALRIHDRLKAGMVSGDFNKELEEAHAWAVMGMNVFLGLRYAVWARPEDDFEAIPEIARSILTNGLSAPD
ncbi:TetR/AcrR family transcriptional regulator [Parerythrobacter jejuensis]|uniref:TetR family transcriptional regulator n=1 Tax=Parerythrobacter jejuensis TaxID=795812 RepID=A0A845ATJ3_9SPHN|nr:TetR/AcrR family transcriptional regulator [Parerythrobacter jejuensis]MXP32151.1 TetR family transcriptional regulator [Parerythrobacter jejuensis]